MTKRMNLTTARGLDKEQAKTDFSVAMVDVAKEISEEGWTFDHIYVFVTSSVRKCRTCKKFDVNDFDGAFKFFNNRVQLKSKRLFVAMGVDYVQGAKDLLISGTDY